MRTDFVVVTAPGFDHDGRFCSASEPLERQALVAELAVEAFIGSVLPGFPGVDQRGVDAGTAKCG